MNYTSLRVEKNSQDKIKYKSNVFTDKVIYSPQYQKQNIYSKCSTDLIKTKLYTTSVILYISIYLSFYLQLIIIQPYLPFITITVGNFFLFLLKNSKQITTDDKHRLSLMFVYWHHLSTCVYVYWIYHCVLGGDDIIQICLLQY